MAKTPGPRDPVEADVILGKKIRSLRVTRKVSQQDLGNHLGVTFQQIQKYEKGLNRVNAARLQKIAVFFETEVTAFYSPAESGFADSVILGNTPQTIRMLRAYNRIQDMETKHRLVFFVESIATGYP